MIINKIIKTTVDLVDPNDIYNPNRKEVLMQKLTAKYVGVCFSEMLITKIVDILQMSETVICDNKLDASAYVDLVVEIEGQIILQYEVIHQCKSILSVKNIVMRKDDVVALLTANRDETILQNSISMSKTMMSAIANDLVVPIIAMRSTYTPNRREIAVEAMPLIPMIYEDIFYVIDEELEFDKVANVEFLVLQLINELNIHANLSKKHPKLYEKYSAAIYPYSSVRRFDLSPLSGKFAPMELQLLDNSASEITSKLASIKKGDTVIAPLFTANLKGLPIYISSENYEKKYKDDPNVLLTSASLFVVLCDIIKKRLLYLTAISGMVQYYSENEEQRNKFDVYISAMNMLKRPA